MGLSAEEAAFMAKCKVERCQGPRKTRGYCNKHYIQIRRHGRLMLHREYGPRGMFVVCKVEGCEGKHRAHGYCGKHYRQVRIYGRLTPEREYRPRRCVRPDCNGLHYVKGYCKRHYDELTANGRYEKPCVAPKSVSAAW